MIKFNKTFLFQTVHPLLSRLTQHEIQAARVKLQRMRNKRT